MVDLVKTFFRAGIQRLEAAEILYDQGVLLDALYLSGYCVECSMKAMILSRVPKSRRKPFVEENFLGQRAHDIEFLRHLWKENRCEPLTNGLLVSLRTFRETWTTSLRYEVGGRKAKDVAATITFSRSMSDWVKERL